MAISLSTLSLFVNNLLKDRTALVWCSLNFAFDFDFKHEENIKKIYTIRHKFITYLPLC